MFKVCHIPLSFVYLCRRYSRQPFSILCSLDIYLVFSSPFCKSGNAFNHDHKAAKETGFGCLLQMQDTEMYYDSCALLVRNFNPWLCTLKANGDRHILITKFDVEETLDLRNLTPKFTTSGEVVDLEVLVGIYDQKFGPPKEYALESMFVQWPSGNYFKRVFTLHAYVLLSRTSKSFQAFVVCCCWSHRHT